MKKMLLIIRRDFREIRLTAAFRIVLVMVAAVIVIASAAVSVALRLQSWYGASPAAPFLDLITGLIIYFLPFLILLTFIWAFASLPVTREKVNGNIECLLATPLGPRSLWLGKGLAVFLPAYGISVIATAIALLIINLAAVVPGWGTFSLPGPSLLVGLVINPLLFFALVSFMMLFALSSNPDVAIAPSFLIGFGLMIGLPVGLLTGTIHINSWSFVLCYLAGTLIAWAIVFSLLGWLTPQKIVLSSRGS
jgi:ABC-type transport system involved in multi-copper enzyme maturation permease subunit